MQTSQISVIRGPYVSSMDSFEQYTNDAGWTGSRGPLMLAERA